MSTDTTTTSRPRRRNPRNTATEEPAESAQFVMTEDGTVGLEVPDEVEGSRIVETPPKIPTPTLSERAKDVTDRFSSLTSRVRRGSSKGPKVKGPRQSVEKLITTVWNVAARMVQPVAWPVANVLHVQAPVAGMILEDVVKNTAVDAMLQPLAKIGKGGEVALALLGPPVLVGLLSAKPETAPVAVPLLKEALRAWIDIAGPKMMEVAEREKKFKEEYGSTIDDMIALFFTPPEGMEPQNATGTKAS